MADPCQLISNEISALEIEISSLQDELETSPANQKSSIVKLIQDAQDKLHLKTTALANCQNNYVAENTYKCNDGALYYFTQSGTNFYWFGEHQNYGFANIFIGTRTGNLITGNWYDVPKGLRNHQGTITLAFNESDKSFTRIEVTGDFAGSLWQPYKPYIDTQKPAGKLFKTPGHQSKTNLTGAWIGNNKTNFYLNQIGEFVIAFAEGFNFSGIFWGPFDGQTWDCNWATVAKSSSTLETGTTLFNLFQRTDLGIIHVSYLQHTGQVNGISDTRISKVNAVDCSINLTNFEIVKKQETFSDEPFLWTCLVKLDGDTVAYEDIDNATAFVWCRGEHGDVQPGAISPTLGLFYTTFKTIRDLEPFDALVTSQTKLAIIVLAFEQDLTDDNALLAGRRAFETTLLQMLQDAIRNSDVNFQFEEEQQKVLHDAIVQAIKDAQRSIYGLIDPDDFIGFQYKIFSLADLTPISDPAINFDFYSCFEFVNLFGVVSRDPHCPIPDNPQASSVVNVYYKVTGNAEVIFSPVLLPDDIPARLPISELENN